MKKSYSTAGACAAAVMTLTVVPPSFGQNAPSAAPESGATGTTDEIVILSPFVVSAEEGSTGYGVKDTLAGTRVRTELKDVASSISVVNSQFLKDTGARNNQDLLVYTTSTEVAGTGGNFSGLGSTVMAGFAQNSFANPSTNTRVRGVDSADNTRDYFTSDIPWDSYIVDRVDLQRGPNSILFGVGSPAGIVNTSTNGASFKTGGKLESRFGSYGSYRTAFDYNQVLLKDELSLRLALLDDDTKYRQDPAFNRDRRVYAALRFDPSFLNKDWGKTTLRANFEYGKVRANRPRYVPPEDRITPFFRANDGDATNGLELNRQVYDSLWLWQSGVAGVTNDTTPEGGVPNYWITQYKGPGMQTTNNTIVTYTTPGAGSPASYVQALPNGDTTINGTSWGVPYYAMMGIAGYAEYAQYANLAGASTNVWKSYSLTDRSIFDFYNKLLDGPNKKEWQNWHAFNVALEQTLLNNRLAIQLVYDRQDYTEGQERNINNPYISVDINQYVGTSPIWDPTATANPYAGYAFVGSGTRDTGGSLRDSLRESFRATLTGELRAEDFLAKNSTLARILGRHVFTGLYDNNTATVRNLSWTRYAFGIDYSNAAGLADLPNLTDGNRVLDWITYLGDVGDRTSAAGAQLSNITAAQSPSGTVPVRYWSPTWNSAATPADATWTNPYQSYNQTTGSWVTATGQAQNLNPANYAGWTTSPFAILNADEGDRDQLYTAASKLRTKIDSKAFTWQGYFWDDTIVPTWGVRRDKIVNDSGYGALDATTGSVTGVDRIQYNPDYNDKATANSVSWGVVVHLPKALRGKLPWGTDVSVHYNHGQNTRSEIRYGFSGNRLPNATGKTEEYGFTLSTLHDKLQFKTTWYETTVSDANMASTTGQNGTLGANTYYLYLLPTWGTAHAAIARAGLAGELSTRDSNGVVTSNAANGVWDWVQTSPVNSSFSYNGTNDPLSAAYQAEPLYATERQAITDWFANMDMGQTFWDAYGIRVNSAAWQGRNWDNLIGGGWTARSGSIGALQALGSGRIRGTYPIGTADTRSTGVEMELMAQPFKGLNVSINATRTFASQTALGVDLVNTIEDLNQRLFGNGSRAGDMRLWWGGDTNTIGQRFIQNIWAPYQFQVQTNGRMVSEMSPWRFNSVVNYSFDESLLNGRLKGVNLGAGYRWQKAPVIGYLITRSTDAAWIRNNLTPLSSLDVDLPVYGEAESDLDLWIGYNRQLTAKINWNIQLNLRSVGKKAHLQPISVQPLLKTDGSYDYANYRIKDGMTWTLTNTFSF
ncbi:MAG TPA: TonB-dependent receptor plug domain-containing protein [Opitutaceae bacterium]|nr:TonB-dependent receptor plug domain-containing protein [Opitutaceae bacterium]